MMHSAYPLVSCVCVTNKRSHFLKRAIDCFLGQSYPEKEMIIVCPEDDDALKYIAGLKNAQLIPVTVPAGHRLTLGELRNVSLEHCNGKYFCQWDDDDWSHRDRLSIQVNNLLRNHYPATMLTNLLMYDAVNEQAYFSNFRLWEGTVMGSTALCKQFKYRALAKAEDYEFSHLLLAESKVYPTVSHGLYIYLCHSANTCNKDHFKLLFSSAQPLSKRISRMIGDIFNDKYSFSEASDMLESEEVLTEIDCFHFEKRMLRQQAEEAHTNGNSL